MVHHHIVAVAAAAVGTVHHRAGQNDLARLGGHGGAGGAHAADVHTAVVGAADTARGHAAAHGRCNDLTGAHRPNKAAGAGRHIGGLQQLLDLCLDLLGLPFLRRRQLLIALLGGGVLGDQRRGLVHLLLQLVLLLGQQLLLLLLGGLLCLDILAGLPDGVDEVPVVLRHLVDKFQPVQQVCNAGGLEQHRQIGQAAPLLLATHLLAEQGVLLGFHLLILCDLLGIQLDLLLRVVDLFHQQLVPLVQQVLGAHHILFLGLGLGDLLLQLCDALLLLLLFPLQLVHFLLTALLLLGLFLLLGQLLRRLLRVGPPHGAHRSQRQHQQQRQRAAQKALSSSHARSSPHFSDPQEPPDGRQAAAHAHQNTGAQEHQRHRPPDLPEGYHRQNLQGVGGPDALCHGGVQQPL